MTWIVDDLTELTDNERIAKRAYEDACDALEAATEQRADNPCQKTLTKMILARKRVDDALEAWREAQQEFADAWADEFGRLS